ncbi:flagellar FlbD family protein [Proteocatella sphenisci]|uniref:flagellar FlbD family protein n=1 Tax=Proteocatella sphenisci TaxID=181070 RepID=UPI00048B0FBE|nr:flagellar FlbD family protein [Proteocatella sphenisci]
MIKLTKLNNEEFVINCAQIMTIDIIPESKITLMNKEHFIVLESIDEIIEKTIEYNRSIMDIRQGNMI